MAVVLSGDHEIELVPAVNHETEKTETITPPPVAEGPRLIQVTNLSVKATDKQIEELFQQIGPIDHVEIFPKDKHRNKFGVLVAYLEFESPQYVYIAQHMTSTVFIDKPIVIVPVSVIPSEYEILQLAAAMSTTKQQQDNILTGDNKGEVKQLVSTIAPTIPSHIANPVLGNKPQPSLLVAGLSQTKELCDSSQKLASNYRLIAATGVPMPIAPKLVEDYTMQKEREARRTVYVDNLDPFLTAEHILNYFQFCGDIRYLRIGGDWMEKKRFAFIEFFDLASVNVALQYDGADFCNMQIRVIHSRHWLGKPPTKQTEAEREKDLLMKRLLDAQTLIANAVNEESNPTVAPAEAEGSPKRKRSRSGSKSKRRRHRSRDRKKSRDRSKSRKKKSIRRSKDRSRSKEKKARSGSRHRRSRSRDRKSKSRERTSRSRDRKRRTRSRSRDKRR
ncbi:probable splicing factor, arginine/serine-rich 7 [Bolinopsis microptera]|uniref:probable splicing factor, arginine/serine-rich 7 n=1 Tax=Bolinopsis microptera TaxID=2820187 RepID=UPI003079CD79